SPRLENLRLQFPRWDKRREGWRTGTAANRRERARRLITPPASRQTENSLRRIPIALARRIDDRIGQAIAHFVEATRSRCAEIAKVNRRRHSAAYRESGVRSVTVELDEHVDSAAGDGEGDLVVPRPRDVTPADVCACQPQEIFIPSFAGRKDIHIEA